MRNCQCAQASVSGGGKSEDGAHKRGAVLTYYRIKPPLT
jgi:hypothetical protein